MEIVIFYPQQNVKTIILFATPVKNGFEQSIFYFY